MFGLVSEITGLGYMSLSVFFSTALTLNIDVSVILQYMVKLRINPLIVLVLLVWLHGFIMLLLTKLYKCMQAGSQRHNTVIGFFKENLTTCYRSNAGSIYSEIKL